jgi:hypothetical protein
VSAVKPDRSTKQKDRRTRTMRWSHSGSGSG